MKTLFVVRHAKSSWDNPGQADVDRPLNERGNRDAPRMGKRLKEREIVPDVMLSSPAKRTLTTCKKIAEVLKYPEEKIMIDRKLYHAGEDEILEVIKNVKDKYDSLMIFGHNPGLTDFVNFMMDDTTHAIVNLPTCGIIAFKFDVKKWSDVKPGMGKVLFFDFPKSKDD